MGRLCVAEAGEMDITGGGVVSAEGAKYTQLSTDYEVLYENIIYSIMTAQQVPILVWPGIVYSHYGRC